MKAIALLVLCLALEAAFLLHVAIPGGATVALEPIPRDSALVHDVSPAPRGASADPGGLAAEPCVEVALPEEQARSL
jgi:hypothetical protein